MFTAVHIKVICPWETTRDYWVRKKPNKKPEGKQPQGSCLHHDAIMTSLCGQNDVAKLFFWRHNDIIVSSVRWDGVYYLATAWLGETLSWSLRHIRIQMQVL